MDWKKLKPKWKNKKPVHNLESEHEDLSTQDEMNPLQDEEDSAWMAAKKIQDPLNLFPDDPDWYPITIDRVWKDIMETRHLVSTQSLIEEIEDPPPSSVVCVNVHESYVIGKIVEVEKIIQDHSSVLKRLHYCAKASEIKRCPNPTCKSNQVSLERSLLGQSTWFTPIQDWLLQFFSCYLTSIKSNRQSVERRGHLAISICQILQLSRETRRNDPAAQQMLPDRVFYEFMMQITRSMSIYDPDPSARSLISTIYSGLQAPVIIFESDFSKAELQAAELGICKNRLWNVLSLSHRTWYSLPSLMMMVTKAGDDIAQFFKHTDTFGSTMSGPSSSGGIYGHQDCTADLCHFSSMDSTRVVQKHKCSSNTNDNFGCRRILFPEAIRNSAEHLIWNAIEYMDLPTPQIMPQLTQGTYIAISHVWSDGTGAGVEQDGHMNSCLFRYFSDIAIRLQCKGIWWDAISVPTERKLRAQTIRKMHLNYSLARYTVVHDEYLVRFPWANDGTPCLALLLSPWFSRGWTAVELAYSKNVKILFKDPENSGKPLIKDLERDVLANSPFCSLGHVLSSDIIRRLRSQTTNPQSLLWLIELLQTRSTSWPRDRVVIAALLAKVEPEVDVVDMQTHVTQQIITSFERIDMRFLFHGNSTIATSGLLSWCPSNLFFGNTDLYSQPHLGGQKQLRIDKNGKSAEGEFLVMSLSSAPENLQPVALHPSVSRKIQSTFTQMDDYLLATTSADGGVALIVKPMHILNDPKRCIICNWIGVVRGNFAESKWVSDVVIRFSEVQQTDDVLDNSPGWTASNLLRAYNEDHWNPNGLEVNNLYGTIPLRRGYCWNIKTAKWERGNLT
ncbi:hypothetical protein BS50DRAFT_621239 [Corynespora cassiicola Philippines]|uniref:Heterokaryon incompatibility domain-containing protein n=1 Tax=Corynespora cassiicola Philippines TaxID=1448308 RepID=A0A2T2NPI5_CORCC|nr:hypothetical protein BS50DRAFT_621239 [Corynespora cassiicola Philippines]